MIELPETYVLADQINNTLLGKTIHTVTVGASPHAFAWYSGSTEQYQEMLTGKKVTAAHPGTGYTCGGNTEVLCEDTLLVLSTPLRYHMPGERLPAKHQLHVEFVDESSLTCTVQMWGAMFCYRADENGLPEGYKVTKAPTPLQDAFDEAYFSSLLAGVKDSLSLKAFLATEQRIPGLGNGVLQDILFQSGLHPKTKLNHVTDAQLESLYATLKQTLFEMTVNGGRDTEKDLYGCNGGYKTLLSAKTLSQPCPQCSGKLVREAYLGGNIYYCPNCQPYVK